MKQEHSQGPLYGATNPAFIEDVEQEEEQALFPNIPKTLPINDPEIVQDKPEDERENWDSKLTFLLATIGYVSSVSKQEEEAH